MKGWRPGLPLALGWRDPFLRAAWRERSQPVLGRPFWEAAATPDSRCVTRQRVTASRRTCAKASLRDRARHGVLSHHTSLPREADGRLRSARTPRSPPPARAVPQVSPPRKALPRQLGASGPEPRDPRVGHPDLHRETSRPAPPSTHADGNGSPPRVTVPTPPRVTWGAAAQSGKADGQVRRRRRLGGGRWPPRRAPPRPAPPFRGRYIKRGAGGGAGLSVCGHRGERGGGSEAVRGRAGRGPPQPGGRSGSRRRKRRRRWMAGTAAPAGRSPPRPPLSFPSSAALLGARRAGWAAGGGRALPGRCFLRVPGKGVTKGWPRALPSAGLGAGGVGCGGTSLPAGGGRGGGWAGVPGKCGFSPPRPLASLAVGGWCPRGSCAAGLRGGRGGRNVVSLLPGSRCK